MERELLLLGLLRGQDMHGYQLHEVISRVARYCIDLKKPTVYFLLDKLAEQGWLARTDEQEGNRPTRRVYRLTEAGEEAFQALLRANLASYHPALDSGDIGLGFADALPPTEARALLAERRAAVEAQLNLLREAAHPSGSLQLIIEHQFRHLTTELEWLDEVMDRLSEFTEDETHATRTS